MEPDRVVPYALTALFHALLLVSFECFDVYSKAQTPASATQALVPYPPFDASNPPNGDRWDGAAGVDQCGNSVPPGGIWTFDGLIEGGFLNTDGTPDLESGIAYRFDNCSQTVRDRVMFYLKCRTDICCMSYSRMCITPTRR